jgi:Ribbon-helix-helix protein, copG family
MGKQSRQSFSRGPQPRASSKYNPNKQKQINIHKQNNHHAGGNNRRGRRTKINFGTTARRRVGTVTQLAKRPTVQILTISNVRSDVLEAIDELAAKQDRSRSSFVRRELQRIVADYKAREALGKAR